MADNKKEKILLIEDDALIVRMYQVKFNSSGYEVLIAFNGKDGLQLAKDKKPNIILLDILMPKMDGFKTLELLKKNSETNPIPVIILTNVGKEESIQKGLSMGATDYLVKARLTPIQVVRKIEEVLKKTG